MSCYRTMFIRKQYIIKIVLCQDNFYGGNSMARVVDGEKMNMIGGNLRKWRRKKRMSQQMISNKLELLGVYVCRGSISRIEDYSRTVTDIELVALARVLQLGVEDLLEEERE